MKISQNIRWTLPLLLALLAMGCGMKAPSNASGGARQPKRGFEKPAGTFKIKEHLPESVREYAYEDEQEPTEGEEDAATEEESLAAYDADNTAAASEATLAAPTAIAATRSKSSETRTEDAPDLAPHLKNGEGQLVTDLRAGLPGFMMTPGSASEAEVRAERLHRLLLSDPPTEAKATVVAVRVRANSLAVFIEVPMSEDPSVRELSAIARNVVEKTAKAIPEAADPNKAVEIEVHAGKHHLATWKAGTWEFTPSPESPLKN